MTYGLSTLWAGFDRAAIREDLIRSGFPGGIEGNR